MADSINVLITDDHPFFRGAIASILKVQPYVAHIEEANNGQECLDTLASKDFDVLLLDINMPDMDGIECLREIRSKSIELKTIILTQYADLRFYRMLMSMGANGYLLKSTTEDKFIQDFEGIVFRDEVVIYEELKAEDEHRKEQLNSLLRPRQIEVLNLLCKGYNNYEIADYLHISVHTVLNHRKAVMKKTGQSTTQGLMKWAEEHLAN